MAGEFIRGLVGDDFDAPAVLLSEEGELSIVNATGILKQPVQEEQH
jgi:hypothetical protein